MLFVCFSCVFLVFFCAKLQWGGECGDVINCPTLCRLEMIRTTIEKKKEEQEIRRDGLPLTPFPNSHSNRGGGLYSRLASRRQAASRILAQAVARACQATVRLCITAWCVTVNEKRGKKAKQRISTREKQSRSREKKREKWIEND